MGVDFDQLRKRFSSTSTSDSSTSSPYYTNTNEKVEKEGSHYYHAPPPPRPFSCVVPLLKNGVTANNFQTPAPLALAEHDNEHDNNGEDSGEMNLDYEPIGTGENLPNNPNWKESKRYLGFGSKFKSS